MVYQEGMPPYDRQNVITFRKTLAQAEAYAPLWDKGNGQTLCLGCHKKTPTYCRKLPKQV